MECRLSSFRRCRRATAYDYRDWILENLPRFDDRIENCVVPLSKTHYIRLTRIKFAVNCFIAYIRVQFILLPFIARIKFMDIL